MKMKSKRNIMFNRLSDEAHNIYSPALWGCQSSERVQCSAGRGVATLAYITGFTANENKLLSPGLWGGEGQSRGEERDGEKVLSPLTWLHCMGKVGIVH